MFSRSAGHTPTGSLMYEGAGYHAAGPGAGLPYHVSMTAAGDKSSLLLSPALASQPRHHTTHSLHHHQGNLQPGYPPRPVETSSHSCDKSSSTGQLRNKHKQVFRCAMLSGVQGIQAWQ